LAIVFEYEVRPKTVLIWLQKYTNPDSQVAQETSVWPNTGTYNFELGPRFLENSLLDVVLR